MLHTNQGELWRPRNNSASQTLLSLARVLAAAQVWQLIYFFMKINEITSCNFSPIPSLATSFLIVQKLIYSPSWHVMVSGPTLPYLQWQCEWALNKDEIKSLIICFHEGVDMGECEAVVRVLSTCHKTHRYVHGESAASWRGAMFVLLFRQLGPLAPRWNSPLPLSHPGEEFECEVVSQCRYQIFFGQFWIFRAK